MALGGAEEELNRTHGSLEYLTWGLREEASGFMETREGGCISDSVNSNSQDPVSSSLLVNDC